MWQHPGILQRDFVVYPHLRENFEGRPPFYSKVDALVELWESLRVTENAPARALFSPRLLKDWLPHIAIVEAVGEPRRFRVRMMGTACARIAGSDNTGKWIDECVQPDCLELLLDAYAQCLDSGEPIVRKAEIISDGRKRTIVHRLFLPCLDSEGQRNTILIAAYAMEQLGRFYDMEKVMQRALQKPIPRAPDTDVVFL